MDAAPRPPDARADARSDARLGALFALFTGAYGLSYFFRSANAVIAPDLMRDAALGAGDLGFMTSLFYLAYAAAQVPIGVALDRWGPRPVTPALLLLGALGCALFAASGSLAGLSLGRVLIGVGMGGVILGALKAFGSWYPPRRFATLAGALFGLGSLGALLAATPLVWLNALVGWRAVFAGGAGVVVLAAALLWRATPPLTLPTGAPERSRAGAAADPAAPAAPASPAQPPGVGLARLLPLAFCFVGTLLAFQTLWAGPYLFEVAAFAELRAGNTLLLLSLGVSLGYGLSGWAADRFGLWRATATAAALFALAQAALAGIALLPVPPAVLVAPLYAGFGVTGGFCILPLSNARRLFPAAATGRAVALVNLAGIGGAFALQWALGLLLDAVGDAPPGVPAAGAYGLGLLLTSAATGAALLAYAPLRRRLAAVGSGAQASAAQATEPPERRR